MEVILTPDTKLRNEEKYLEYFLINPGNKNDLKTRLLQDIKNANQKILMAMGFLYDIDIINAIRDNKTVKEKRVILNAVDVDRAYNNAVNEAEKKAEKIFKKKNIKKPTSHEWLTEVKRNLKLPANQEWVDDKLYVVTLGNSKESNQMHHKFLIIDKEIWIGSYNFTNAAGLKNWENMILIKDNPNLFKNFETEFYKMYRLGIFFYENFKSYIEKNKCSHCTLPLMDSHSHFLLKETLNLEMTVGIDYHRNEEPVERLLQSSTSYEVECINKNTRTNPTMNRKCDGCGDDCTPYDITESIVSKTFINDGSVEFFEAFHEDLHKDGIISTSYKCPRCFIKETKRSRHYEFWDGKYPIPDYS